MAKRGSTRHDSDLNATLKKMQAVMERHEDMMSVTVRRIADLQAEVDLLKREIAKRRLGKKR